MNFVSRYWSTLLFIQLVPVCGYVSATCDFRCVFIKKQNQSTMASSAHNPPKLVDKKGAKSSCWAHFRLLASNQSIAVCKLCNKQYVYKGRELVWPFLTQIYCPVTSTLADAKSQLMFNNMKLLQNSVNIFKTISISCNQLIINMQRYMIVIVNWMIKSETINEKRNKKKYDIK